MEGLHISKILAGLRNPELYIKKLQQQNNVETNTGFNSSLTQARPNSIQQTPIASFVNNIQMNSIANMDRAIFIRNLLNLPQTLGQMLQQVQTNTPLLNMQQSTLLQNINANVLENSKVLAEIFEDFNDAETKMINPQILQQTSNNAKDITALIFSGMISLPEFSQIVLKNSKEAIASLILSMATASKNGMSGDQIRENIAIINSCVAMLESNNPTQTIKSLMLLYLPWLPLTENTGFDLEIETNEGETESNDSRLTVLIQTKNYGNIKGVFTLTTSNSVDIYIICPESFPKKALKQSLLDESKAHSMNTTVDIEAIETPKNISLEKQEAKVNLSATNEMNPYLLLIAHAFIRNTIFIDNNSITEKE